MEKDTFIKILEKIRWLSTTADICTAQQRAYLGFRVQYVEPNTLDRVSLAIACRWFKGSHTGSAIGKMLFSIFEEFKISLTI